MALPIAVECRHFEPLKSGTKIGLKKSGVRNIEGAFRPDFFPGEKKKPTALDNREVRKI